MKDLSQLGISTSLSVAERYNGMRTNKPSSFTEVVRTMEAISKIGDNPILVAEVRKEVTDADSQ